MALALATLMSLSILASCVENDRIEAVATLSIDMSRLDASSVLFPTWAKRDRCAVTDASSSAIAAFCASSLTFAAAITIACVANTASIASIFARYLAATSSSHAAAETTDADAPASGEGVAVVVEAAPLVADEARVVAT